jgi:peptide/nickel transport system substrate-binding protein/oligopeptide transport system substrate-binding protein
MNQDIQITYRRLLLLLAAGALLLLIPACTSLGQGNGEPDETTSGGEPAAGDRESAPGEQEEGKDDGEEEEKNRLVYAISPPPINLDPIHTFTSTEAQVYTALYEGLVEYHPFTLEPMPATAARWEISSDDTLYTFHLRERARYSNGDPVKAQHFRDTWLKLIDPQDKAEYASHLDMIKGAREYRTGKLEDPDEVGITVEDEHTLKVELRHPATHFLKILCHHSFAPVHPSMLEDPDWETPTEIPTNGPFYIAEEKDDSLLLKKNSLYWDSGMVQLDELEIRYIDDPEKAAEAFNEGEIHWADTGLSYDKIRNRDALVVNPLFSTFYYFFSAEAEPFDQPAVRRGLALLLPWDKIRSEEYMYIPTDSLVPKIGDYPDVEGISAQNQEKGLELLAEAGFPQGRGLPELRIAVPDGEETMRIAELMKGSWEEQLEVSCTISQHSFDAYYDELKENTFTVGTLTWIGDYADPLTFLKMWTGDSSLNLSGYRNSEYDGAIEQALAQEQSDKRLDQLAEAEKLLLDEAAVLPIKHSPAFNVINLDEVEGWFPNPLDIHPFKYLRLSVPSLPQGVVELPSTAPSVELAQLP